MPDLFDISPDKHALLCGRNHLEKRTDGPNRYKYNLQQIRDRSGNGFDFLTHRLKSQTRLPAKAPIMNI